MPYLAHRDPENERTCRLAAEDEQAADDEQWPDDGTEHASGWRFWRPGRNRQEDGND